VIWQIALTVFCVSIVLVKIAGHMDSPFPLIKTKWTYIAGLSGILAIVSGLTFAITAIWGL